MSVCAHLTSQTYLPMYPLKETIGICAEALYKDPSFAPPNPKRYLSNLWKMLRDP